MVCVYCGSLTQVTNSRSQKRNNGVWRRRRCLHCQSIFTSLETVDYAQVWNVQSIKGTYTPFSQDKLFLSIWQSCRHRATAKEDARQLTDTVMEKLRLKQQRGILAVYTVIDVVQVVLNRFDKAASVYYAALHSHKP